MVVNPVVLLWPISRGDSDGFRNLLVAVQLIISGEDLTQMSEIKVLAFSVCSANAPEFIVTEKLSEPRGA